METLTPKEGTAASPNSAVIATPDATKPVKAVSQRKSRRAKITGNLPALFKGVDKEEVHVVLQNEAVTLPDGTKGKAKASVLAIPTIAELKANGVTDKEEIDEARNHAGKVNFAKAQAAMAVMAQDEETEWLCGVRGRGAVASRVSRSRSGLRYL